MSLFKGYNLCSQHIKTAEGKAIQKQFKIIKFKSNLI